MGRASRFTWLAFFALSASVWGGENNKRIRETWDTCYLQGTRAGYVHTFTDEYTKEGEKRLRTTVEFRLNVRRFDNDIELGQDVATVETPEGSVLATKMKQMLGKGKSQEIIGVVSGKKLDLTLDRTRQLESAPWRDDVLGLYRQHCLLKERKVKSGDTFRYFAFEPTVNLVLSYTVVVKNVEEVLLPGTRVKRKLLRVEIQPQRLEQVPLPTLSIWLNDQHEEVCSEFEVPGLGVVKNVRSTRTDAVAAAKTVGPEISQLVPIRSPITNAHQSASASYRIRIKDDPDPARAFDADRRQRISSVQGDAIILDVRAVRSSVGQKPESAIEPEYLKSSYFITSDDPLVKDHARKAVGLESSPRRQVERIESWLRQNMKVRDHEALATADHVAKTLEGDCTEFAMLMAAMCRAKGIPARTAVGLVYAEVRGKPSFAFHMWTEVFLDGDWIAYDATLGLGGVGACHLKISHQSWQDVRDMTPLFPVLRVLGRLEIDVRDVTYR